MKLSGIDGINYSRLASLYRKAGVYSNFILCIRSEGLQQIKPGSQLAQTLIFWSDRATNIEDYEDKVVMYFHSKKFDPSDPYTQNLISLVESIPADAILIELVEESQLEDVQVYGTGSDLLPDNTDQLLVDSISQVDESEDEFFPDTEDQTNIQNQDSLYFDKTLPRWIE
jgi:hypothetical protein